MKKHLSRVLNAVAIRVIDGIGFAARNKAVLVLVIGVAVALAGGEVLAGDGTGATSDHVGNG